MDATTGERDRGDTYAPAEPAPRALRLCDPYDADPEPTRRDLANQLERLRNQLQAGEAYQRRGAEELGRLRHEIGLVRARLQQAGPDAGLG
jgi:hypothetical protein